MPTAPALPLWSFNGVDGSTGRPLVAARTAAELAAAAKGVREPDSVVGLMRRVWERLTRAHWGLPADVTDPTDLAQVGWAVVFHAAEPPAVRDALRPLIDHRRAQVGDDRRCRVLDYADGELMSEWLARHGAAPGSVRVECVPYYVLLVGGPERIPFTFGQQLDVEYAVGRVSFATADAYGRYAESLLRHERGDVEPRSRTPACFATAHAGDEATTRSADRLARPLAESLGARLVHGADATKAALGALLGGGAAPPAFLFTATHGVGWPAGHPSQVERQGALLCADWDGGPVQDAHAFAAADVGDAVRPHGLVSFHFGCYSGGTPTSDRFAGRAGGPRPALAPHPFAAALPAALLSAPAGGALACVGHVDRTWSFSFDPPDGGRSQLLPFENAAQRILSGEPVGHAVQDFNLRYAALSAQLAGLLEQVDDMRRVPDDELAIRWVERNDAEGYVVLGDPAARLRPDLLV